MKKITIEKIHSDCKRAGRFSAKWKKEAETDLKYVLGEQWEKDIKEQIESEGRPALTLNITQANVRLVTGYQRDSRSSIKAYPEGGEDEVVSEIVTRLLKNTIKNSKLENVLSEAFETCVTARGKAFIEPYIDYTYDLINGSLQFNVLDGWQVKIDPKSTKYNLSDARYVIKEKKLTKDELLELFPDEEKKINDGINLPMPTDDEVESGDNLLELNEDFPSVKKMDNVMLDEDDEQTYTYIEYFYKKYITQFLAVDSETGVMQFFKTKKEAKDFLSKDGNELTDKQRIITKRIPEVWVVCVVGMIKLDERVCDSYPRWKGYPIIPLFGWYSSVGKRVLKREDLAYQGIASSLRDPQDEKNKRRSQSLHIINSIANAGWLREEGAWVNEEQVKKFGSTPGVDLVYRKGAQKPERIYPSQIPQAHLVFEEKSEEDIKLISGINPDLLSIQDKTTSGRAIALRQQQGLKILKPLFDNLVWTQELVGKYIVSQLTELYTVEKALKVLGGEFIEKHFRKNETDTPELIMAMASQFVENILSDDELCNYDIAIGEGLESPTERYAQYSGLVELGNAIAPSGAVIPPSVFIDYADISESAKKEIKKAVQNAQPPVTTAGK